ncbi:MAG: universal stress protein [Thiotrichales bacterium]
MAPIRHVAVAIDFSPITAELVQCGRQLANWHSARLSLLHVVDDALLQAEFYSEFTFPTVDVAQWERLREEAVKRLEAIAGAPDQSGQIATHLLSGAPKSEITRFVDEQGVDLLVMGSHGHRGVLSWLGSTTDGVLHRARCDLYIVRLPTESL